MSNREAQAQPVSPSMQMTQLLWPGAMAVQAIHVAGKLALVGYAPEQQPGWKKHFWTHFWFAPQFYVTVIFVAVAWILWRRGLRLHKYKNLTGRGRAFTIASLLYGLFMAAFYVIEGLTEPAIEGTGTDYMMHGRHWGTAGMGLSFMGVVIAFAGRGAARLLMILLMIAFFAWWFLVEGLSHLTW